MAEGRTCDQRHLKDGQGAKDRGGNERTNLNHLSPDRFGCPRILEHAHR
jgi:hypothetical protein